MDIERRLADLRQEKKAIEQAILSIEKLAGLHRRGIPPSGLESPRRRGRPPGCKGPPRGPGGGMPAAAAINPEKMRWRRTRAISRSLPRYLWEDPEVAKGA